MPGRPQQAQSIELELMELEQDVDKTLLREALLLQGRTDMKAAPDTAPEDKEFERHAKALRDFIDKKKGAIIERATRLTKTRGASRRAQASPAASPAEQKGNREELAERIQKSQIDIQLLEAQVILLREPLNEAIRALAKAEVAASKDEAERPKAEAARKEFEKIKARVVEQNKRLQLEQQELQSMNQVMQMGGYGGGMR
jgi:hypothetical protein